MFTFSLDDYYENDNYFIFKNCTNIESLEDVKKYPMLFAYTKDRINCLNLLELRDLLNLGVYKKTETSRVNDFYCDKFKTFDDLREINHLIDAKKKEKRECYFVFEVIFDRRFFEEENVTSYYFNCLNFKPHNFLSKLDDENIEMYISITKDELEDLDKAFIRVFNEIKEQKLKDLI